MREEQDIDVFANREYQEEDDDDNDSDRSGDELRPARRPIIFIDDGIVGSDEGDGSELEWSEDEQHTCDVMS